jgi:hypothetical protein
MSQLFLRMTSAAGLLTLALFFVGIDPFLSAGADLTAAKTPAVSVNHMLKGDRLPFAAPAVGDVPDSRAVFGAQPSTQPLKPFACDPAFSPIASKTANVYRRCLA